MARNGFAEFLIARRAELRPGDVGMPEGRRRRTQDCAVKRWPSGPG
ncbi:hypothetical protein [Nocardia brasiliensis]|nr:hypothetical protein [Nocardia brasiliensis]